MAHEIKAVDSLVIQLQRECLDSRASTLDIMRKALVVARKLGVADFQKWIDLEMQGYKVGDTVPEYRVVGGQIKAWNPYHGWIDAVFDDPKLQDVLSHRPIGQSIGEIETLVQQSTAGVFRIPFDPHTEHELMRAGTLPLKPKLEVSSAAVKGILDKVRTTVLDWCLDLEAKGVLGEHMTFSEKEKQTASAANYHVHFHGAVTTSQIQLGSIHSSQTISMEIDLGGVKTFVTELGKRVAELGLAPDSERQMSAELTSVEAQLAAPQPNRGVIAECLTSVRNILEGCVGSLIASGFLQKLSVILPR